MKYDKVKIGKLLTGSAVPLLFLIISIIAIPLSGFSGGYLANQIVTRLVRNSFLVLSLLLPIVAGMGINFGMVLGAMAGQIGLIFIADWGFKGAIALVLAMIISTPIAMLLGFFGGQLDPLEDRGSEHSDRDIPDHRIDLSLYHLVQKDEARTGHESGWTGYACFGYGGYRS